MKLMPSFWGAMLRLHWPLIGLVVCASCMGFAMQFSAAEGSFTPWAGKQMMRFVTFFPVMIALAFIPLRFWLRYAYVFYVASFCLLVGVEFFGSVGMGAKRWVRIAGFNIQPSEMMKIALVLALARYFHLMNPANLRYISALIVPILMVLLPVALIIRQPDLGTSLILLMVGAMVFFIAGVALWKFITVGVLGLASLPFLWSMLHNYQKNRVLAFLYPERDPQGSGYNILQSKIAIGSGGVTGKGYVEGTQSQLSFLPERQTDFIFTMLAEEFGFLGGLVWIVLCLAILLYGMVISLNARSEFGRLLGMGVVSILFLHMFINMAMVMGLIPVVGAPLPFLSYGGTMMLVALAGCGLLLNVDMHGTEERV